MTNYTRKRNVVVAIVDDGNKINGFHTLVTCILVVNKSYGVLIFFSAGFGLMKKSPFSGGKHGLQPSANPHQADNVRSPSTAVNFLIDLSSLLRPHHIRLLGIIYYALL